jgi:hypothetical protein
MQVLESVGILFLMDDHFCCDNRARVLLLFELIVFVHMPLNHFVPFSQLELRWQLLDWQLTVSMQQGRILPVKG